MIEICPHPNKEHGVCGMCAGMMAVHNAELRHTVDLLASEAITCEVGKDVDGAKYYCFAGKIYLSGPCRTRLEAVLQAVAKWREWNR